MNPKKKKLKKPLAEEDRPRDRGDNAEGSYIIKGGEEAAHDLWKAVIDEHNAGIPSDLVTDEDD